jgi:hypothetical protein
MAVYKIFPEKSATLYSYYPTLNAGIDEILDLSTYNNIDGTHEVARPIIQFPQSEITDVFTNKVAGASYSASLRLFLAQAYQLPQDYTIVCRPLVYDWKIGNGRFSDSPTITDGVSWEYIDMEYGTPWYIYGQNPPGSAGYFSTNVGGGLWWSNPTWESYQSFINVSSKDINLDVTNIVNIWFNNVKPNYGFILKHIDSLEFTSQLPIDLKYFSANTNTIYPPCLEIKWDDYSYNTGSLSYVNSPNIVATLANNQSEYQQDSIQRFIVNIRDKFPARAFSTTSVYLINKVFIESGNPVYQIKDLDTEEIVVDYDDIFTRVCCDPTQGNYFDIYMNGLEPERYYKILIKVTLGDTTMILDDNYFFKVIR